MLGTAKLTAEVTPSKGTEEAVSVKYLRARFERTGVKCLVSVQKFIGLSYEIDVEHLRIASTRPAFG